MIKLNMTENSSSVKKSSFRFGLRRQNIKSGRKLFVSPELRNVNRPVCVASQTLAEYGSGKVSISDEHKDVGFIHKAKEVASNKINLKSEQMQSDKNVDNERSNNSAIQKKNVVDINKCASKDVKLRIISSQNVSLKISCEDTFYIVLTECNDKTLIKVIKNEINQRDINEDADCKGFSQDSSLTRKKTDFQSNKDYLNQPQNKINKKRHKRKRSGEHLDNSCMQPDHLLNKIEYSNIEHDSILTDQIERDENATDQSQNSSDSDNIPLVKLKCKVNDRNKEQLHTTGNETEFSKIKFTKVVTDPKEKNCCSHSNSEGTLSIKCDDQLQILRSSSRSDTKTENITAKSVNSIVVDGTVTSQTEKNCESFNTYSIKSVSDCMVTIKCNDQKTALQTCAAEIKTENVDTNPPSILETVEINQCITEKEQFQKLNEMKLQTCETMHNCMEDENLTTPKIRKVKLLRKKLSLSLKKPSLSCRKDDSDAEDIPQSSANSQWEVQHKDLTDKKIVSHVDLHSELLSIESRVKQKQSLLEDLERAEKIRDLHNVYVLERDTATWKQGCEEILVELLKHVQKTTPMTMNDLLLKFNIPENFLFTS